MRTLWFSLSGLFAVLAVATFPKAQPVATPPPAPAPQPQASSPKPPKTRPPEVRVRKTAPPAHNPPSPESHAVQRVAQERSGAQEFGLPDPSARELARDELERLSEWQLLVVRNYPYARHGYAFQMRSIRDYFDNTPWYRPTTDPKNFDQRALSPLEQRNILLIDDIQNKRKSGGPDRPAPPAERSPRVEPVFTAQPSFNCKYAKLNTEKLLCRDQTLAALDVRMAGVYQQVLEVKTREGSQKAFIESHVTWFKQYTGACNAEPTEQGLAECVRRFLTERTDVLRSMR